MAQQQWSSKFSHSWYAISPHPAYMTGEAHRRQFQPVRTVMNYQYRYGTTTKQAAKTLYTMGGFRRYYQGLLAALIQGPTSRFGDTAANAGILALLESNEYVREKMPSFIKTAFAALAAALFRMLLTPVDTIKTTMQTQGARGMEILRERVGGFFES